MLSKIIMVQGTTSNAGKSLFVTALCRIFNDMGYKVAPFKSQNMSLNSGVTEDGLEIARSQIVQAMAARTKPLAEHNPVLLKPKGAGSSQIMLLGKPYADYAVEEYYTKYVPQLIPYVEKTLETLRQANDVIVIEGAGSPAEINLMQNEIANMFVARLTQCPVILVGDIDRGGVFASIYGTIKLLPLAEQELIKGFVINKFRGNYGILQPGIKQLEDLVGKKCLGVVPLIPDLRIPAEDSQDLQTSTKRGTLDVKVIRVPQLSNFTDIEPLMGESMLSVEFVDTPDALGMPDVIILPGTKNTVQDFKWLEITGLATKILSLHKAGTLIVGICGGYQFLGEEIVDTQGLEGGFSATHKGLGLLPIRTEFLSYDKITKQVKAEIAGIPFFNGQQVEGYEIHMGKVVAKSGARAFLRVLEKGKSTEDKSIGTVNIDGTVFGTFLHGFFDNDGLRHKFIEYIHARKKDSLPVSNDNQMGYQDSIEKAIQQLSAAVKANVDIEFIKQLMGL